MSDEHMRQLERQAALGDHAARASWLRERLRAGAVSPTDLRLAVTCGEAAAFEVLAGLSLGDRATQEAAAALGVSPGTLRRWVQSGCPVTRRGRRLTFDVPLVQAWRTRADGRAPAPAVTVSELEQLEPRAGLQAAHAVLAWTLPRSDGPDPERARPLLQGVAAWLTEPGAAREEQLGLALAALQAEPSLLLGAARDLALAVLEPGSRLARLRTTTALCAGVLSEWDPTIGARLNEALAWVIRQAIVPARLGLPPVPPPDWLPPLCDYRVRAVEGHAHGGPFELEQDTTWEVVHRPSGAVVLSFAGEYSASYDGSGWSNGSWSGVSDVRLAADGRSVLVSEGGSSPRRVPIPDA